MYVEQIMKFMTMNVAGDEIFEQKKGLRRVLIFI